jgi:2-C-methyl-D-erythritol 4-phosphate cytidylyltransferase
VKIVALVTAENHGAGEITALSPVHGEPLLTHAVRGLLDSGYVDLVVVATPAWRVVISAEALRPLAEPRVRIVAEESVRQTLSALAPALFLVHDAARAFTPPELIGAVVDAVRAGERAVVPVLPMSDTVKLVDAEGVILGTQDRELLRTAQTPLGFTADALFTALETGETDLLTASGEQVHTVEGHPNAMRIATPFELTLAEAAVDAGRYARQTL